MVFDYGDVRIVLWSVVSVLVCSFLYDMLCSFFSTQYCHTWQSVCNVTHCSRLVMKSKTKSYKTVMAEWCFTVRPISLVHNCVMVVCICVLFCTLLWQTRFVVIFCAFTFAVHSGKQGLLEHTSRVVCFVQHNNSWAHFASFLIVYFSYRTH